MPDKPRLISHRAPAAGIALGLIGLSTLLAPRSAFAYWDMKPSSISGEWSWASCVDPLMGWKAIDVETKGFSRGGGVRETICVQPRSFVKTKKGGRVRVLNKYSGTMPDGEPFANGTLWVWETNCDEMEYRYRRVSAILLKGPEFRGGGIWREHPGKPYVTASSGKWFSWKTIEYGLKPQDKWICDQNS